VLSIDFREEECKVEIFTGIILDKTLIKAWLIRYAFIPVHPCYYPDGHLSE